MTSAEILEWVMGWAWPIILVFVLLIAGGVLRLISWDKEDLSEHQSAGPALDKDCSCQCQ